MIAETKGRASDRVQAAAIWIAALVVTLTFGWLLADVVRHGLGQLSWAYLTTPPVDSGRAGGIGPILVSTAWIVLVCLAVVLPLGLATAALLGQPKTRSNPGVRAVRRCVDVLAGVPSIVFGLFGNALFSKFLGLGFSILSGGLTLACMALPLFIRTAEEGFRAVPEAQHRAAAALAISRWTTLRRVLLPAAMPSIVAGTILSIGRALAETAALIFTSGYVDRSPESLLDSGRSLSIHIYDLAMNIPGGNRAAYGAALVLTLLLLLINTWVSRLGRRFGSLTGGAS